MYSGMRDSTRVMAEGLDYCRYYCLYCCLLLQQDTYIVACVTVLSCWLCACIEGLELKEQVGVGVCLQYYCLYYYLYSK
jgi:hypothetical protein